MSGDFEVGDVVVRVAVVGPAIKDPECEPPPIGSYHTVADVVPWGRKLGLRIPGWPSSHPTGCWGTRGFRKLPKADESFTQQIRACKPQRNRVPA